MEVQYAASCVVTTCIESVFSHGFQDVVPVGVSDCRTSLPPENARLATPDPTTVCLSRTGALLVKFEDRTGLTICCTACTT